MKILKDKTTGLEWLPGPDKDMSLDMAKNWVKNLNRRSSGWRLPTLDEIGTLFFSD